ncbi:MAG TPA: inositol monophosphatase family protein [Usitatibacter sp.]|nr:inositol monophosphatase family protein [Usitatibacter sp.]
MDITVRFAARAIDAVRRVAAEEVLPRYRSVVSDSAGAPQPRRKDDGSIVTEADFAAQEALARRLAAIEDVPVLAEEMNAEAQRAVYETASRYWCIDPIDGTRNFSAGIPFFAISVALMEAGRTVFGTVYDPIADEAYYAVRGAGAWINHRPLELPAAGPPLARAVAEVSPRRELARLRGPLKRHPPYAKRLVSGSSALSWCHLAAARTDVLLHGGQKMWDYAAGALVLEEARGFFCTVEQDDFWSAPPWSRSVIAARTAPLLDEWRTWIRRQLASASNEDR